MSTDPRAAGRANGAAQAGNGITQGVIWKQLMIFFFPILLGTFFQQLYNTVDAIIVGKFVGKESLAAVGGATGILLNALVGFFVGLSSGATVIISQFYGGRRDGEVNRSVHTAVALALTGGLLLSVLGFLFLPSILQLMNTPPEVIGPASTYARIYALGMTPSLLYNVGAGILRAVGDSRRPLYFLICACMVNILLDILFVVGFEMGVAGAAWATILSQLVSAVLVIITLCRSHQSYRLRLKNVRFHPDLLKRILRIGFPAGLQSVLYSVSNIIIQISVNGFGTDVLAAWTAFGKIDSFFWMITNSFGIAITTFAGQNFGAGNYDRMKRSVKVCLWMTAGATLLVSFVFTFCGQALLRMFTADPQVLEYGLQMLRLLAPTYLTYICIEILSGAVRGAGDTLAPTLMTLTGICVLRAVWVLLVAPAYHSVTAVLLCYPITWTVTSLLFVWYYTKTNWLGRCIQKAAG